MATTNKNFKVKNGLEVGTTTVVASIDSSGNANIAGNLTANTGFVSADTFRIDTTFTGGTTQPGEIAWDVDEGTVMFQLADGAVTHRIGQQLDIRVVNNTGSTISEGAVVYINGSSGQEPTIALANAATEGASSKTIGVVTHQGGIANAASGYICISGIMRGVDVGAYAAGTPLWLSNVAGVFTDTKPTPPDNGVFIGWVVKAGNAGSILVAIQNGYEVNELHDVLYTSLAADNILQRNSANTLWVNRTLSGANIANLAASTVTFAGNVVATTNVNATTFNGSGAGLTSIPNSATTANSANGASTIVARDSNGSFVANAINSTTVTATGIVTGLELTSTNSSGSEGGQVNLAKPATTSLSGNVIVDIYENKIRFFDSAGTNRGAYIDLTAAGAGVGTNLLGGVTGAMNASYTYASKQSNVSSAGTILANVAITTNGYPIQVIATGDMENNSAGGWVTLQLYRGSTAIGNIVHAESSAGSENVPFALTAIDVPAAGTYTYSLRINSSAGGTFNFGESNGPTITVIELSGPKGDTGAAGTSSDSFKTISTPSGTSPVADSATDTLTLSNGTGITITGDATADSITIATNGASANGASTLVLRDSTGNFSANIITATLYGNANTVTNGVYTTTTSLPNVTSVNGTTIPASAGLLTTANIGGSVQGYDSHLASIAGLADSAGYLYNNGSGTFSYNNAPLTSASTLDASKLNTNTVTTLNVTNVAATNVNATTFNGSGSGLTNIPAANLTGTAANIVYTNSTLITPTGAVIAFAGSSAPSGWLLCDGSAVSRTTYATLFAIIGTTYGIGDGSTTFNLPNLKGSLPVGLDSAQTEFDTLGETGGTKTVTLTVSEIPSHTHTLSGSTASDTHTHTLSGGDRIMSFTSSGSVSRTRFASGTTGGYAYQSPTQADLISGGSTISNDTHSHGVGTLAAANTGSGTAHNNLQPYLVMNYIIKT